MKQTKPMSNMKLEIIHMFYAGPTPPRSIYLKSRFSLLVEGKAVGQMMTEKQARSLCKSLGFKFPTNSTLNQWTVAIGE